MSNTTNDKLSPESKRAVEAMLSAFTDVMETGERPIVLREFLDIVSVETERERNRANSRIKVCDALLAITGTTAPPTAKPSKRAKR